jgi:hypothetical protein
MAKGITILEGSDLRDFLSAMGADPQRSPGIYRVRIWAVGGGSIKIKVNEGMWTPALGEADI